MLKYLNDDVIADNDSELAVVLSSGTEFLCSFEPEQVVNQQSDKMSNKPTSYISDGDYVDQDIALGKNSHDH